MTLTPSTTYRGMEVCHSTEGRDWVQVIHDASRVTVDFRGTSFTVLLKELKPFDG